MDEKDLQILNILRRNGRSTGPELSRLTRLPSTTVHNRVKRLEKEGIIRGYAAVLDPQKMGRAVSAFVLVSVHYPGIRHFSQDEVARKIKALPGVEQVAVVAGESDLILQASVEDITALNRLVTEQLRAIPGVDKTRTMVILNQIE